MKTKLFVLVLVFIAIMACAIHPREKIWGHEKYSDEYIKANYEPLRQQTLTFDGLTFDQVWNACERTLIRIESAFYMTDKASGEVRVGVTARMSVPGMQPGRTYTLSISIISITDKKISVQASILVPNLWKPMQGRMVENDMDYEIDRFMQALKKRLKKYASMSVSPGSNGF